jgi:hypothetical protein
MHVLDNADYLMLLGYASGLDHDVSEPRNSGRDC